MSLRLISDSFVGDNAVLVSISRSILLYPFYFGVLEKIVFFLPYPFSSLQEQGSLLFFLLFIFEI